MKHSLTKYVVFSISILLIYTIAELIISIITGQSNDTLTTCIFACFGGEILSCALIKIFKLKEQPQQDPFTAPVKMPDMMSEEEINKMINKMYYEEDNDANG